jgi:hypothetical protein
MGARRVMSAESITASQPFSRLGTPAPTSPCTSTEGGSTLAVWTRARMTSPPLEPEGVSS